MFFSAVISPEHWENVFSTNCNGPLWFTLKTTLGKYLYWTWNPTNLLESTFRANLSELRYPFWVDYYLTYLTTNKFYDQPMFESRNICDLGLLQNARTHGPRGTVKTIEKYILHRTQVHYFCSGNSNQDLNNGITIGNSRIPSRYNPMVVPWFTVLNHVTISYQQKGNASPLLKTTGFPLNPTWACVAVHQGTCLQLAPSSTHTSSMGHLGHNFWCPWLLHHPQRCELTHAAMHPNWWVFYGFLKNTKTLFERIQFCQPDHPPVSIFAGSRP